MSGSPVEFPQHHDDSRVSKIINTYQFALTSIWLLDYTYLLPPLVTGILAWSFKNSYTDLATR